MIGEIDGLLTVTVQPISMDMTRPKGTDFKVQNVSNHLSCLIVAVMSGEIADSISFSGLFLFEVLLCIATFIVAFYLYQKKDCYDYSGTIA